MALDVDTRPVAKDKFGNAFDGLPQSSEEDEPVQIKRKSFKKALDSSDDENDNLDSSINATNCRDDTLEKSEESLEEDGNERSKSPLVKKKKQRRVLIKSDSDESDPDDRPASRNSEEDHGARQRQILESLRSDNAYDAESSEGEGPASGRDSGMSNRSDEGTGYKSKTSRPKQPGRKSAAACRAAIQKERLKMVSESQRMVRESKASLPYHKPRQRSLKEFLSARLQPSPLLRGAKFQQADIALIGQEMEKQEKLAEEFYKPASDISDEERFTPPPPEVTPDTPVEDKVLRVLLTASDQLAKDILALADKADESCLITQSNSDQPPTICDIDTPASVKEIACESADISASLDQNMESDVESMEVVASKEEEPMSLECKKVEEKTLESSDSSVVTCPEPSGSIQISAENSQSPVEEITKTQFIPSLKPFSISKVNVVTEDACLTPSDALKDSDIFVKPAAKTDDSKSKDTPVEDSVDTDEFHLFFEDSDDILKSFKDNNKNNEKKLTPSDIEEKPDTKLSPEKIVTKTTNSNFDLTKLYNSKDISSSDDEEKSVQEKPKGKARILADLKLQSGPVRLKGSSGGVIDLDEDSEVASGVDDLVQRFLRHAQSHKKKGPQQDRLLGMMQAGEQMEDTTNPQARPGAKMNLLKTELRHSIAKQRDEEFNRRQKEYKMYEDEAGGMLGDDDVEGKLLSDEDEEETAREVGGADSEGSTETEPELEDDVELRDAPRPDSEFLEAEAEESEGEPAEGEGDEKEEEEDEENEGEEGESEGEEEDSPEEDNAQGDKTEIALTEGKKTFQRIKLVEDSDDEDGPASGGAAALLPSLTDAAVKPTVQGDSLPDTQPLETPDEEDIMDKSFNSSIYNKSFNLSMLETSISDDIKKNDNGSPSLGDLCGVTQRGLSTETAGSRMPQGITQLIEESRSNLDLIGVNIDESQDYKKESRGFPKSQSDLFQSSESLVDPGQSIQGAVPRGLNRLIQSTDSFSDDLAALCSGQFPTQKNDSQGLSKELNRLIGDSKTQTDNLYEICSGQFITQVDTQNTLGMSKELKKLVGGSSTVPEDLAEICSGQFITQVDTQVTPGMSKELKKLVGGSSTVPEDLAEICSGQFLAQASSQGMSKELRSLVGGLKTQEEDLAGLCSGQFFTQATSQKLEDAQEEPDLTEGSAKRKEMRIVSSDEEDDGPDVAPRKGKRKLAFSDDEDDVEAEELEEDSEDAEDSDVEEPGLAAEGGYVDYDSEENEVVMTEAPRLRPGHFVDAEAELSESEWGSADEDERGLDQLEEELGDTEKFDEHAVKEQLGKIHARRMLDEDKRDVRLFQEAFLEDGDLHSEGEGRQRSFRWKNADDGSWTAGANPNLSGDEGGEDDDDEESTWRSARLEREIWLQENKDKVVEGEGEGESSHLLNLGRSLLAKMDNSRVKAANSRPASGTKALGSKGQSPGKAILQSLKGKSGSFLARRSISMTRMVALSGAESEAGSTSVLATSSRNFVFCTVSPASVKNGAAGAEEQRPAPVKRRAPAAKKAPAPTAKKQRVSTSVFSLMQ